MLREVTFHDDHSVKTKTTRQYSTYMDVYIQSNLKQSQNQAEKLKKLSDVKRKVNFRSSQVEAFINQKVSNQSLIFFNAKIFILNRKKMAHHSFYPLNCCWKELREKLPLVILEYGLKINRSSN